MMTLSAATSPSTFEPDFISMTPSARMLPITRPRIIASFTSTSARIRPCSPTSMRSQLRMSPSNSPSILSVPDTMTVPRMLDPVPMTVLGGGGSEFPFPRFLNIMIESLHGLSRRSNEAPRLKQTLEVVLAEVLELDFSALPSRDDVDVRSELPLELDLPFAESFEPICAWPGMLAPELAAYERLGTADRESLARHVARSRELIAGRLQREQGASMS